MVRDPLAAPIRADAPRHLPILDGARGIAALVVLVSHSANLGLLPAFLGAGAGHMGVILFFGLSGFLMAYLYADRPFERAELARYARHRIGRVVPLYLSVVVASFLLWHRVNGLATFDMATVGDLRDHLLLLRGEKTLWTIPVELHFYLAFVLLWWANSRGRALAGIVTGLVGFALVLVVARRLGATDRYLPFWGHFFLIGVATGLFWRRHHHRVGELVRARPGLAWLGWAILLGSLLAFPGVRRQFHLPTFPHWCDPLTAGLPIGFLFAAVAGLGPFRGLAARPLRWLGDISYGVYIFQWPILLTVSGWFTWSSRVGGLGVFAVVLAVTITIATLSNRLLERPIQRLINRAGTPRASTP